ncbi:hypothetical protein H4J46_10025 [Colwellia sp. MB02u-6]|uniref:hypothetical protein n=1 Tax=Colwellia sp. MB02u-6 TaxID=2759824 RepID=UPI0015F63059|nr:hypothetical protein [Colwellia sp. MB02u-6]MBA6328271.1 hypothetical protein [Colwellia sp. MB02u-6]
MSKVIEQSSINKEKCNCSEIHVNENYLIGNKSDFIAAVAVAKDIFAATPMLESMGVKPLFDQSRLLGDVVGSKEATDDICEKCNVDINILSSTQTIIVPMQTVGDEKNILAGFYYLIFNGEPSNETFVNRFIMDLRPPRKDCINFVVSDNQPIGCPDFYENPFIINVHSGEGLFDCSNVTSPYLRCLCDCLSSNLRDFAGPIIGSGLACLAAIAALPGSAGISVVLAIPACAIFFGLIGFTIAFCAAGCALPDSVIV